MPEANLNVYSLDTPGMFLEMWQQSPPAWIPAPTCDVRNISIQRGRATYLDSFAAGSLNADLASFSGAWNAWNPNAVWQRLGGGPTSVPVRVRLVLAALDENGNLLNSFTATFFTGTIDKVIDHWPNIVDAVASIQATDGFKNLARHNGGARTPVGAGELTGQRINRLADDAAWPSTGTGWLPSPRRIDAGLTHVQATDLSGVTLDLMRTIGESEWGWLYMDVDDCLVFRQRDTFVNDTRMTNVQWTFIDTDTGFEGSSHVCYQDLALAVDEDTIINVAQITPNGLRSVQCQRLGLGSPLRAENVDPDGLAHRFQHRGSGDRSGGGPGVQRRRPAHRERDLRGHEPRPAASSVRCRCADQRPHPPGAPLPW